jgi:mannose-6-phosphate isomerase-like protein (cupin superfamily)
MKEETYSVLRARRFELVDAANRPWATLGFNKEGEVQFSMLNRKGNGEILLLFHEEEPEVWLVAEGNTRARLSVTHGEVELELFDDNAQDCLKLKVDSQGAPHILTRTGKGELTEVPPERGA